VEAIPHVRGRKGKVQLIPTAVEVSNSTCSGNPMWAVLATSPDSTRHMCSLSKLAMSIL
jgi:hypothetical protein